MNIHVTTHMYSHKLAQRSISTLIKSVYLQHEEDVLAWLAELDALLNHVIAILVPDARHDMPLQLVYQRHPLGAWHHLCVWSDHKIIISVSTDNVFMDSFCLDATHTNQ